MSIEPVVNSKHPWVCPIDEKKKKHSWLSQLQVGRRERLWKEEPGQESLLEHLATRGFLQVAWEEDVRVAPVSGDSEGARFLFPNLDVFSSPVTTLLSPPTHIPNT